MKNQTFMLPKFIETGLILLCVHISIGWQDCSAQGLRSRLRNELVLPDGISQLDSLAPVTGSLDLALGNEAFAVAEQDEVWMIDGRESHCNPNDLSLLEAAKYVEAQWEPSSLQEILDAHNADQSKATLIYVHGDRTNDYWAVRRGMQYYQNVFGNSSESRTGVRFVIFAWKSEKTQNRPMRDFPLKSSRARLVGQTLATYLTQFQDQRLVLAGYSLGCQAWLEALEQLSKTGAGSTVGEGYRVCLLAPALDGNYVASRRNQTACSELVARADIFDNSADRALLCSRVLGSRSAPGGGASIQTLAEQGSLPLSQITLIDLRDDVGKKHAVVNYSAVPIFGIRLREMVEEANQISTGPFQPTEVAPINETIPVLEVAPKLGAKPVSEPVSKSDKSSGHSISR